ncbi:MAG: hypothetical protein EXR95_01485 [Gemmatimonadetes bacterium]|nr:hypothetical protein [Gemmatimonadota bacterium]
MKRGFQTALVVGALVSAVGCGDTPLPTDPPRPEARVAALQVVSGAGQHIWSGRRSTLAFRVRALDAAGAPLAGAQISFRVTGDGGGDPSQPHALTDAQGYAESWLLRARSGAGMIVAEAGVGRAELAFVVDRAAGEIRFLAGSGAAGLPGRPHPDSVLAVVVLDTDGRPLGGQEVWFAAPGTLSRSADTTDVEGRAETRLGRTHLSAGSGDVWAFILAFPGVLGHDVRPVLAPARRVVLVSVEGLRADALGRWGAATLLRLAREGGYVERALTVSPALTAPAQLSMLAGVPPEAHGILADELTFTPAMAALDPVFRHAAKQGRHAVAFMSREGPLAEFERALSCRLAFGLDSLRLTPPEAGAVVDAAQSVLADPAIDLVFLHLPDPGVAGQRYGFESAEYGAAVRAVDAALARIVARLSTSGETLLIVTSDHGGGGAWGPHQHGSDSPEDNEVPLIVWGARAAPTKLADVSILDVAPTMLWALGMAPPASYRGRVLLEAFR